MSITDIYFSSICWEGEQRCKAYPGGGMWDQGKPFVLFDVGDTKMSLGTDVN